MYIILRNKLKYYTKECCKFFSIMAVASGLIIAIILLKYKPIYEVTLNGETIGYVKSETKLSNRIDNEIIEMEGKNIDFVSLDDMPNYELKLVNRTEKTNEEEILIALKEKATIMYKYYAVTLNGETVDCVDNLDEAVQTVNNIKEENKDQTIKLDLEVIENHTEKLEEISIETIEVAQEHIEEKVEALIEEDLKTKRPIINGILLAVTPISGTVTSRFGEVSNIRSGAHTGTDICSANGTPIKAVAKGTVVFSGENGPYGNLVRISHGNGVETWYAHCSELYVEQGQAVKAGDVISAVGQTGNTTGPHLHLEIRINGRAINPQQYLYKRK